MGCDEIGHGLAVRPVDAPDLLPARIGDFGRGGGDLDAGHEDAVFLDSGHLVNALEDGIALGRDEALANAETVYLRAFLEDGLDGEFIEAVGSHDGAVRKTGLIEHFAGLYGEIGEVAGVNAYAPEAPAHRFEHFPGRADGVRHAGLEDIVGIHKQDGVVRIGLRVVLESLEFGIKVHDPAVSHGAADGNAEFLAREHGGRADCSADVGGSRAVNGSVHVVGAAGAKVGDEASLGSAHDAVGLGGDERLVIGLG